MASKKNIILIGGRAGSGKDTAGDYLVKKFDGISIGQADPMKRFLIEFLQFTPEQMWGPSHMRNIADPSYALIQPNHMDDVLDGIESRFNECAPAFLRSVLPNVRQDDRLNALETLTSFWLDQIILEEIGSYRSITPRLALQTLGTDWGRDSVDRYMWTDHAIRTADLLTWGGFGYDREKGLFSQPHTKYDLVVLTDGRFISEFERIREEGGIVIKLRRDRGSASSTTRLAGISGHQSEEEIDTIPDDFFDAVINNNGSLEELYASLDRVVK